MKLITFLSDFGLKDEWVGICKGVIKSIAPEAQVVDLSHLVSDYDVREGAFLLFASLPYLPAGIHLAVVDPRVGTERKGLIIEVKRGDLLVGPDNGLLIPAAKRLGGISKVATIENEKYLLTPASATFHGRDVFAPVAGYLSLGVPLEEFGPPVKRVFLAGSPWPEPKIFSDRIESEIINIDKFGNLRMNLLSEQAGLTLRKEIKVKFGKKRHTTLPLLKTFGELETGQPLLYNDSSGVMAIGLNQGNAAEFFEMKAGDGVTVYLK